MELIEQHIKKIMEDCKKRARKAGLEINTQTLEYIITNQDLIQLEPKIMIPTLYDFWMHDIDNIKGSEIYKVYPSNPYETVINTRPAISFYNDNNTDWMNVFIFYHVLAHIDFFQNNIYFEKTWDYDFCGQALSDKRLIEKLREKMGENKRWVDYTIEFARSLNNLVNFYAEFEDRKKILGAFSDELNFYFDIFLNQHVKISTKEYLGEIGAYNQAIEKYGQKAEEIFLRNVEKRFPDFAERFKISKEEIKKDIRDVLMHIMEYSEFIKEPENRWMKQILQIIRNTSLFFQPQIRTKILNEGWASLWHEELFLNDPRIKEHEIAYSLVDARVVTQPRIGLNPYALGKNLLLFMKEMADKGKLNYDFQKIRNIEERSSYDLNVGMGKNLIFDVRKYFNDYRLFSFLSKDDFQDFVDKHNLFVAGRKLDSRRRIWQYYVKSRNGEDYRKMVINSLYHPPKITVAENSYDGELYMVHEFEGRQLVRKYIEDVLRGASYLWGGEVKLETTIFEIEKEELIKMYENPDFIPDSEQKRVVFSMDHYKGQLEMEEI